MCRPFIMSQSSGGPRDNIVSHNVALKILLAHQPPPLPTGGRTLPELVTTGQTRRHMTRLSASANINMSHANR